MCPACIAQATVAAAASAGGLTALFVGAIVSKKRTARRDEPSRGKEGEGKGTQ